MDDVDQYDGARRNLYSSLEDEIFASDDADVLAHPDALRLAASVRAIAERATNSYRSGAPEVMRQRRTRRTFPARHSRRRAIVRELLVADPGVRQVLGRDQSHIVEMSDTEIDAAFARLIELDIVTPEND